MLLSLLASSSDDSSSSGAGSLIQLGILLLIPLGMYYLLIRPQRRRIREQAAVQSSLEVGDEVITNAGFYGFITGFDGDTVWIEIDDDVQVRVAKAAIQGKVPASTTSAEAKAGDGDADDADDD